MCESHESTIIAPSTAPSEPPTEQQPVIVGIGLLPGGLADFSAFWADRAAVDAVAAARLALVIVLPVEPPTQTDWCTVMEQQNSLPLHIATHGQTVRPHAVYLIPATHDASLVQGRLHLTPTTNPDGRINTFFQSLAHDQQAWSVGLLFGQAASDQFNGILGLRAIKEYGGLGLITPHRTAGPWSVLLEQLPDSLVDAIVPAAQISQQLILYAHNLILIPTYGRLDTPNAALPPHLHTLFILLREQTGHDFTLDNRAVILRRITRHMSVLQLQNLAEYVTYLTHNRHEVQRLFHELLIGMTSFCREPGVGEALGITAVQELELVNSRLQTANDETILRHQRDHAALIAANDSLENQVEQRTALLKQQIIQRRTAERALQRESAFARLLQDIAVAANEATSVEEAFRYALNRICDFTAWPLAHVFVRATTSGDQGQPTRVRLVSSGIWRCDNAESFAFFRQITGESSFETGQGWMGQVLASGKPAWIANLQENPIFLRNHRLVDLGIRAGFAFPVLVANEITAVLEFFATTPQPPDDDLLTIMTHIGAQLSRVVEREQARQAIRRAYDFHINLFETFPTPIWRADSDGKTNYINQTWLKFTGRTLQEELDYGWLNTIHPDDRVACMEHAQHAFQTRTDFVMEYRMQGKDGQYRWFFDHGCPYNDLDGNFAGYIGFCYDITEQKEALESLRRSEAHLEEAQHLAHIGAWEFNPETGVMMGSDEMYNIFDLDPATTPLTLPLIYTLIHPDEQNFIAQRWRGLIQDKMPFALDFRIVRPNGEIRHLHSDNRLMQNNDGEVIRFYGAIQDETRNRLTQEFIRRKADQLAALNQMGQTVVSTRDLHTIFDNVLETTRRLIRADGAFILLRRDEETFHLVAARGAGLEKFIGQTFSATAGITGEVAQHGLSVQLSGQDIVQQRLDPQQPLTDYRPHEVLAAPLHVQNEVFGMVEAIHNDPTYAFPPDDLAILEMAAAWTTVATTNARLYDEIFHSEEQLRELTKQMVNTQEEERRRVSRELHDEAGQALTALKLSLDMLAADLHDNPRLERQLGDARRLTEKTMQRIRALAYDLRPPELDTIGLDAALSDLCENFARRTRLAIKYTGGVVPSGLSDATQLSFFRFLQEALTNVIRHAEASKVTVTLLVEPHRLALKVRDNGRGLDTVHGKRGPGAGLGLLGMEERFERVGGDLHIYSEKGRGTTLIASVPLRAGAPKISDSKN